ncbi:ligand-binding sensor domain-containing protein [Pseudoalteromonas xiamenensis]
MVKIRIAISLWLYFCFLTCVNSYASEFWPLSQYNIQNWSIRDGLPQVSVYDIAKDDKGFFWLATEKGVVKFDGDKFTTYSQQHSELLENPRIKKLLWTNSKELLIATDSAFFRMVDDEFKSIDTSKTQSGRVIDMLQLPDGKIYVAAGNLYEYQNGALIKPKVPLESVSQLAIINNRLCLSTAEVFGCLSGNRFIPLGAHFPPAWQVQSIIDYQGLTYLGTQQGLYSLGDDQQWHPVQLFEEEVPSIRALFKQDDDTLWVGTETTLYRLFRGKLMESVSYKTNPILSLVLDGFVDESGNLWLGTLISGLVRTELNPAHHVPAEKGIAEPFIWSVGQIEQTFIVGTATGLYQQIKDHFEPFLLFPEPDNPAIYSFYFDAQKNELWLGTKGGLYVYDAKTHQRIKQFESLAQTQINSIIKSSHDRIWFGTQQGLWIYNNGSIQEFPFFSGNQYGGVRFLYEYQGQMWIGTEKGLLTQNGDSFTKVNHTILEKTFISYMGELSDGRLMVGTFQHGLFIYNGRTWQQLSVEQGLPMDNVTYAAELGSNLLWAGLQGVMNIDMGSIENGPLRHSLIVDNTGNGSQNEQNRCCNGAGSNKGISFSRESYFPTVNGLLHVYHRLLKQPAPAPRPLFERLEANGKEIFPPYQLEANERDWRLVFTVPHYGKTSGLEFRYQLVGYDATWRNATSTRDALYTNLPGGDYTFRVQVRHKGYPAWSRSTEVSLSKKRLWHETWWFNMLFTLACGGLIVLIWRLRSRSLLTRQQELEEQVAKRTTELNEVNQQLLVANEQLLIASLRDSLTGLYNRHYLSQNLEKILENVENKKRLTVVLIDIDDFKKINDEFGHAVGDEVLVAFATLLSRHCRAQDHILRWGGEEFVIIAEQDDGIGHMATRLIQTLRLTHWPHGRTLSASIGLCTNPSINFGIKVFEGTLNMADKAMYMVKEQGKDGWIWIEILVPLSIESMNEAQEAPLQSLVSDPRVKIHHSTKDIVSLEERRDIGG